MMWINKRRDNMKNNRNYLKTNIMILGLVCILLISTTSDAGSISPGTVNDPLVTKSYVDKKDGELEVELKERIVELEKQLESGGAITGDGLDTEAMYTYIDKSMAEKDDQLFVVVEATNGQKIICGASAEIILRAGSATVIAGDKGDGLANLTTGDDLRGGDLVPLQHHLLVSRDDGRGFLITSENGISYILVKGAYVLE